jgi:hypothetical protein
VRDIQSRGLCTAADASSQERPMVRKTRHDQPDELG